MLCIYYYDYFQKINLKSTFLKIQISNRTQLELQTSKKYSKNPEGDISTRKMPCSICHQNGHNKRTCPNVLITFNEAVVAPPPPPTLNSSVEVEIGLLCLRFQLPKEVELILQRLSRARPLLTQHDIEFSQAKLELLAHGKQEWREQGRKNSIEEAIIIPTAGRWCGRGLGRRDFKERVKMEWGKGTSKNKTEYQLYFATLQMTEAHADRPCAPTIADNIEKEKIVDAIRTITKEIEIRKGATGATSIQEIRSFQQVLEGCWIRLHEKENQHKNRRPFKKLTMKSLVPVENACWFW